MGTAPKIPKTLSVEWEPAASTLANGDHIIGQFVEHVARELLSQDPTSRFIVKARRDIELDGQYLALLIRHTNLVYTMAEDLLDQAAAKALTSFGVPTVSVVAAME
jgi:hypothetical protein